MSRLIRFVASYTLAGVLVAAAFILFEPQWLSREQQPVVHVTEAPDDPGPTLGSGPVSYADAVKAAAPAVVNVYTAKQVTEPRSPFFNDPTLRRFFGDQLPAPRTHMETSLGSGVIFSSDGYILTNNHVVENAQQIQVQLADGRQASAEIVGTDPETDLAVLRVELKDLPTITVGHSEKLSVGDVVLAIGNPFGVGQTVTQGIVSATGRTQLGLSTFENFIQTDAAINPGNSGGALINARGELVGINTAIYSRSGGSLGIGFAIPVQLAKGVLSSIVEHGRVIRGWAGIQVQKVTPQLAESFGMESARGVILSGVLRDGPADKAGLMPGDIILAIDGQDIENVQDLMVLITERRPGTEIQVRGLHNGKRFTTQIKIEERPPEQTR